MKNTNTHIVNTQSNIWSDKLTDKIETIADLGLDWNAVKQPLVALLDGKYPLPIETHVSISRSDTNESIGIVGNGYEPIQNSRIWEALHNSLEGTNHNVVGGGYTHNGGRVFVQTKVDDENFTVNGDKFDNFITFFSSHDGSSAFEMFDTSVRMICQNTFQSARRKGGRAFKLKVRHTSNANIRFEGVMQNLEQIFNNRREIYDDMNELAQQPMSYNEMLAWATSMFNKSNTLSTISSNKAHEAVRLARHGLGNKGQTRYDMFNGITELLTHGDRNSQRNKADVWRASEFGASATQKAHSLDALSVVGRDIRRGELLIRTGSAVAA